MLIKVDEIKRRVSEVERLHNKDRIGYMDIINGEINEILHTSLIAISQGVVNPVELATEALKSTNYFVN